VTLRDLLVVYLAIGVACAIWIYRKSPPPAARALASAAVAVPLWPLWAPFALERSVDATPLHPLAERVERALEDAERAALGSSASALLSPAVVTRLRRELRRIGARLSELDGLLTLDGFDLDASERRLGELAGDRQASARAHHESLRRLHQQRAADVSGLGELADLVLALRAELLLERQGAASEGVADLVREVSARLEALTDPASRPERSQMS
jgi:hypothetical protein